MEAFAFKASLLCRGTSREDARTTLLRLLGSVMGPTVDSPAAVERLESPPRPWHYVTEKLPEARVGRFWVAFEDSEKRLACFGYWQPGAGVFVSTAPGVSRIYAVAPPTPGAPYVEQRAWVYAWEPEPEPPPLPDADGLVQDAAQALAGHTEHFIEGDGRDGAPPEVEYA